MRGGNFKIEIHEGKKEPVIPNLPFLCIHNQRGTYCGKGLVIKNTTSEGDEFTLVDLGGKIHGGDYNTVFSRKNLKELMDIGEIIPKEGVVIIYE